MRVHRTPYEVLFTLGAYHVVRSVRGSREGFVVAGPFLTRYEAEVEARRRAGARRVAA